MKWIVRRSLVLLFLLIAGCASYQPLPLDASLKPPHSIDQLHTDASAHTELPKVWRNSAVNVRDGLNETEVALLAVLNSPHLYAARMQIGEAQARLVKAGLLPDPQFSTSFDFPTSNGSSQVTGYNFGLGFDLRSLITRGARQSAATKQARMTYLQVLWQEWQIIQQARILYRRTLVQQQQIELAHKQYLQTKINWLAEKNALRQGNATLDSEGLARTSMMDAEAVWFEAKRQQSASMHRLALLLGLSPQAVIALVPPAHGLQSLLALPQQGKALHELLNHIAGNRPDLLALQAGYNAQEARVREQILAQFPGFTIGVNRLRDTGGIWTLGPFLNLNLPLLNGNRGEIALARATRARLRAEFHERITAAETQASRLASDQRLAFDELAALRARLPGLDVLMQRMRHALTGGNVDMLTFTTLQNSYFFQRMKVLRLKQAILEQAIALNTVLGGKR